MSRSILGVTHSAIAVKHWKETPPSVHDARPYHCPRCGVAAQEPDRPLQLVGHGCVRRQIWGPPDWETSFGQLETLWLRRYRCRACLTVIRVGPAIIERRAMYSSLAIALALALWAVESLCPKAVRRRVSPFTIWGQCTPEKWASLKRWSLWLLQGRLWLPELCPPEETLRKTVGLRLRAVLPPELGRVTAGSVVAAVLDLRHREAMG